MVLLADFATPLMSGVNVATPVSLLGGEAYRLTLYPELGRNDRSVLVISMTLQFQFEAGDTGVQWFESEKLKFPRNAVKAITSTWEDKFRITTTSTAVRPPFRDVGVMFLLKWHMDGWHSDDDFEVVVKPVRSTDYTTISETHHPMGSAWLKSTDNDVNPAGQRVTAHEFGHMLGLRDEYKPPASLIPRFGMNENYRTDYDSIMHRGNQVRERHYVPFATWLTEQFEATGRFTSSRITYKVDGTWDASNALL
jgi:hypothetical protein